MKRLGWVIALLLTCAGLAHGQGVRKDDFVINQNGKPIINASVTICTSVGGGTPCTPQASVYSDQALTQLITQPIQTGPIGNYGFYAAPGDYVYTVTGSSINPITGHYTLGCTPSSGGCGGGGGGGNLTTDNTWTNNNRFKGPDPLVDVTTFNARATAFFGISTNTATMAGSSTSVTVTDPGFKNGDGITIWGAGPSVSISTPGAPTVVASVAAGGTMSGITKSETAIVGGTSDSYRLVARDKFGGLSAAGSATTLATSSTTLGLQTATITTCSRSAATVTCNTSAPEGLVIGALVHIHGGSNADFTGWYTVTTVPTTQQFTLANTVIDSNGLGATIGDSASDTGGTVAYYYSNHLTWTYGTGVWEYYVCAERSGDTHYHLIGQTKPSVNGWQDAQFDDFGSPYMDSQSYPKYVETGSDTPNSNDAICTAASSLPDPLTTTILSGAGTGTLTLANASSNPVTNQTALYDAGPNIITAANSIKGSASTTGAAGTLLFPPSSTAAGGQWFVINSYTVIPANSNIVLSGPVLANETIELSANFALYGNWAASGIPQFGFDAVDTGFQTFGQANPLIYTNGGGSFHYIKLNVITTNGGTALVADQGSQFEMEHGSVNTGGGNSDYISENIVLRSQGSGGNNYHFDYELFNAGPDQTIDKSWTPLVYMPPNQNGSGGLLNNQGFNLNFFKSFFNRRGVEEEIAGGNGGQKIFDNIYRQGGITPLFAVGNSVGLVGGYYYFHNVNQDTESAGTLSQWGSKSSVIVDASGLQNGGADTGGTPPPFMGTTAGGYTVIGSAVGKLPSKLSTNLSATRCILSYPYTSDCAFPNEIMTPMRFTTNTQVFWPLQPPSSIAAVVASGGALTQPASFYYNISSVDALGVESTIATTSSAACTTSAGNQTCNVTWTPAVGTASVNIYRSTTGLAGSWQQHVAAYTGGQPYADTAVGGGTTQSPVNSTGAFLAAMNALGTFSPQYVAPETTTPTGIALFDQLYADSTAHQWKMVNNNGTADRVGDAIVEYCGATSGASQACAKTREINPIIIFGDVTLNTATTQSITTLPFTSSSSYACSGSDLTTVTGIVSFNTYAASSVTIAESGGVNTDHLRYQCTGF